MEASEKYTILGELLKNKKTDFWKNLGHFFCLIFGNGGQNETRNAAAQKFSEDFPSLPLLRSGLAELAGKAAGSLQSDNVLAADGSRRLAALRSQPLSINFRRTDGTLGVRHFFFGTYPP